MKPPSVSPKPALKPPTKLTVEIRKSARALTVLDGEAVVFSARVALGWQPVGHKEREGDGKTPEGRYRVCLVKPDGRHGPSLGLSYPNADDALAARARGDIDEPTLCAILRAHSEARRPPWGTPLGGEIYLHGGGSQSDWTQGCVALDDPDMARLFDLRERIEAVVILA